MRLSKRLRIPTEASAILWCSLLSVTGVVSLAHGVPEGLVLLAAGAAVAWYAIRVTHVAVRTDGDHVIVRNRWRTHRVGRDEITGLEIANVRLPLQVGSAVHIHVADGRTVQVEATWSIGFLAKSNDGLERRAAAMRSWTDGR